MDQDINDVYRQTVKISTLFASCCEARGNYYLSTMALDSAHPVVCHFLLEDVEHANDRAYVLEQLISSLNGEAIIKRDWEEYNKHMLRGFLRNIAPQIERKMSDNHVENMANLWRFGQNIHFKETTVYDIARGLGMSETELKQLNKKLIDQSTSVHYEAFFKETAKRWCKRANTIHQQTQQVFQDVSQKIVPNSKVKV